MKKLIYLYIQLYILSSSFTAYAQTCATGGITFASQADIDNFTTNYPGCTQILGMVRIEGADIVNLNGLSSISSIGGSLDIRNNTILTNLDGLSGINSVGSVLIIYRNPVLQNISALSGMTSVIYVAVDENNALENIQGLSGLTSLINLDIRNNPSLSSLSELSGLTTISGNVHIVNNDALTDLTGLSGVSGAGGHLVIQGNEALTSIAQLASRTSIGNLDIRDNPALLNLAGLSGITAINGYLLIRTNQSLSSLSGLPVHFTILGDINISFNPSLTSIAELSGISGALGGYLRLEAIPIINLTGLEGITSIPAGYLAIRGTNVLNLDELTGLTGALGGELDIAYNEFLTNVNGLTGITSVGGNLSVIGNYGISPASTLTSIAGLSNITSIAGRLWIRGTFVTDLSGIQNIDPATINLLALEVNLLSLCEMPNICTYLSNPLNPTSIFSNESNCASRAAIEAACLALPVELMGFTGIRIKEQIELQWKTASEVNNDRFEIQHSKDGIHWSLLGTILSKNAIEKKKLSYSFVDENPFKGMNYYRLKLIDIDETFEYSNIITVQNTPDSRILMYPNPVSQAIHIELDETISGVTQIILRNLTGQVLSKHQTESGILKNVIGTSTIPSGFYFIEVIQNNRTMDVQKFVKH